MDTNLIGSSTGTLSVATDKFNGIYMASSAWGTAITTQNVMPVAGTLKKFYINCDAGPGAGLSRTFAIYKNGSDTAITITVSGGGTGAGVSIGSDTTHTVSFVAGDTISIHSTATGTTTSAGVVRWTLAATMNANQSMILSSSGTGMGTVFPVYIPLQGIENETASVAVEDVMPTAGTIKNAYVQLNASIGAGTNLTFTLVQNGTPTSLAVIISASTATGHDTNAAHAVTVSPGDRFYWAVSTTAAPTTKTAFISVEFDPTTNGESLHMYSGNRLQTTTAARFQTLSNSNGSAYSATENSTQQLTQGGTWKNLYVYEQSSIATGNYKYQLDVNSTAGNPTVTIASGQTGNDTVNTVSTSVADTVSMKITPTSSPTSSFVTWGIVSYIAPPGGSVSNLALLGVG